MAKLKQGALPHWRIRHSEGPFFVVLNEHGVEITLPMSENGARLVAGASALLAFVESIASAQALPASIPAAALLRRLGLELEP